MINSFTKSNAKNRIKYIEYVFNLYVSNETFMKKYKYFANFFVDEYYCVLRDGGYHEVDNSLKDIIYNDFIHSNFVLQNITNWRILFVKLYRKSVFIGNIFRIVILTIKKYK